MKPENIQGCTGFEPLISYDLNFFRLSLRSYYSCVYKCDDHLKFEISRKVNSEDRMQNMYAWPKFTS